MAQPPAFLSRAAVRDGGVAVLLAALWLVPGISDKGLAIGELSPARPVDALAVVLVLAQSLPLAGRTRWPVAVFAVVAPAFAAYQLLGYPNTVASLGLVLALYSVGGRRIVAAVAILGCVLLSVGLHALGSPARWFDFVAFASVLAVFWFLGAWMRGRQTREQDRRRAEALAAVTDERARIARELHDVVTHHVTAMVVQADAAQFQSDPAAVTAGLENVSETGRQALGELRHLLDVLHAPADDQKLREPIADLVERIRGAGQPVDFVEQGSPALLAGGAELAAYRVVQEGLTNAMKHAAGHATAVTVTYGKTRTEISVRTDGPRAAARNSAGHGLAGLAERVSVFGGELHAGPQADGAFLLHASIPAGGHS